MRLLTFFLLCFTLNAYATKINCYSGKTRIYHGFGDNFVFDQDYIGFIESKPGHAIVMHADCIVMAPVINGRINATFEGKAS